ncbi:MAG: S49 family peptidase, partial [Acidimicrobiia bacterium]|nr:S49 family peptidase [Acidimicrobiia bacterium]
TGVNNEYANFVAHVAEARGISAEKITTQIGAFVYDNKTATELGLMDETANRDEAYARLAEDAGIRGDDWAVYEIDRPTGGLSLFGSSLGGAEEDTTEPECNLYRQYLAYFGDVSALCLRRED